MRWVAPCVVCLLVVLAGCSGFAAGSDGARTVNPALEGTPTRTVAPLPGINGSEVNVFDIAAAHRRALENTSVRFRTTRRVVAANGTVLHDSTGRSVARGDVQFFSYRAAESTFEMVGPRTVNWSYWTNGSAAVTRWEYENGTGAYRVYDGRPPQLLSIDPTGADTVRNLVGRYNLTSTGTVTRDGRTLFVVTAANAGQPYVPLHEDVSVRLLVTPEGVVREIAVRYTTTEYGPEATVGTRFVLSDGSGTTVPRPDWVDEALRRERE